MKHGRFMRYIIHSLAIITTLAFVGCGEQGTLSVNNTSGEPVDILDIEEPGGPGEVDDDTPPEPGDDPACPAGLNQCDGACVDLSQTDDNCGTCGNVCPTGTECASSECACMNGEELCDGTCVDTSSSSLHCGTCGNACAGGTACVSGQCMAVTEIEGILAATNAARAAGADCGQYGMYDPAPPLEGNANLNLAAQAHADDMAQNNFFSHTGSDGSSFSQRVARTEYSGFPMGENIAGGGAQPEGVVQRWIDSDGHCRNLMNPQATKLGVGYTAGGPYGTSWVQVFGR